MLYFDLQHRFCTKNILQITVLMIAITYVVVVRHKVYLIMNKSFSSVYLVAIYKNNKINTKNNLYKTTKVGDRFNDSYTINRFELAPSK